ncbi:MAG: MarR family transcriptional regulator [Ilumatobacteraceae bacterium]
MPFAADPADVGAPARIGRAWRELRRGPSTAAIADLVFGRLGQPDAVEPGQLDILDILTVRDAQRMSDLATALHVDPSTITRAVQRMEAGGLARRSPAAVDGRVVDVHITAEGRRLHAVVAERRATIVAAILDEFEPAEREQFVDHLDRFVSAVERYATAAGNAPREADAAEVRLTPPL